MSDDPSKTKVLPDGPAGVLPPGAELNSGMYRVTRKLAEGGFGITYEARDNLERKVAIKECFPAGLALRAGDFTVSAASASTSEPFETARNLFLREARTLANLRHPNIVHVQTLFEENGTAYMAMDYVEGRDLQDVIDNNADLLTPTYLMELTRTLLGALDYLHRDAPEIGKEPLLHRDIKPANIRIDPLNAPVIIDFGAAKQESKNRSRAAGTFRVVSDGYSPSEFYVANSTQGPQSDLYSLAATLYHCISGGKPVPADERAHALQNGKDDPYEPLAGRYPGHDPRLLGLIDRALSLPFKDRPKDAAAWFAAIPDNATRIVETPSPAAVVAPVVDTPPPPAPNNSGFWKGALVGGGLLALLGGGAYFALPGVGASSGDMEEVQRQLEEATGARTGLEAELAAMSAEADDLQAEVAEATEARDLAQARVEELGDTISSLRAQLAAAADGEEATTVELRNQLNQATQELGDQRAAAQDLEAEVAALEAALSAARSAAPGQSEALAEAEVTIERLGTELDAALARQVQAELGQHGFMLHKFLFIKDI
ncbi:protein kinase, partial [Rhodobacterales bacterium HKCCE4037]|nr:protein kinase [Rhodobacterales bacterium HKCCE4037]